MVGMKAKSTMEDMKALKAGTLKAGTERWNSLHYFCRVSEQTTTIKGTLTYFAGHKSNRCRDGDGDD